MSLRIAIAGIYHESNTFVETKTRSEDFREGCYCGEFIREHFAAAHHEIGGMFEILDAAGVDVVPLFFGYAMPGGVIETKAADAMIERVLSSFRQALPLDGCLVVPHGAAVSENVHDFDGFWLSKLRSVLPISVPIVGTLDPHANLSVQMVSAVNSFVAYKTNPHVDQRETGKKAAKILLKILEKRIDPLAVLAQLPLAISIEQQQSSQEPCLGIYQYIQKWEALPKVVSVSLLLGFPYADVPDMGTSILVVTDNDETLAHKIVSDLTNKILARIDCFNGVKSSFHEIKKSLPALGKPILLLDMGDNIGAGAEGSNTGLLKQLHTQELSFFYCLYDPVTVKTLREQELNEEIYITFMATSPEQQFECRGKLIEIVDGHFYELNPTHGGHVHYYMGETAIVELKNKSIVMVTSKRVLPFSLQQLLAFNLKPEQFDLIVAKGVNAPIAAYGKVCKSIVKVHTAGVTQADITFLVYKNRRKPMFPFEPINKQSWR